MPCVDSTTSVDIHAQCVNRINDVCDTLASMLRKNVKMSSKLKSNQAIGYKI